MNKFHVMIGAIALGATVLTGCADTKQINAKLDAIQADVDALKAQQNKLATDVAFARTDAARANERLDNMARRYKK